MSDQMNTTILKLSDSDLTLADENEDIRGRTVVDNSGEEVGEVEDLMLDDEESRVRFLQVGAGGFLGIGEKKFLIPVDSITSIDEDHVHVDRTREHIAGGPDYDPNLVEDRGGSYWTDTYSYYGYGPFWAPGYTYPAFPYFAAGAPGRPAAGVPDDRDADPTDGLDRRTGI